MDDDGVMKNKCSELAGIGSAYRFGNMGLVFATDGQGRSRFGIVWILMFHNEL